VTQVELSQPPMVSVCIPTYRKPDLFWRALQSAFAQSYEAYELIVSDDSPDDSVATVARQCRDRRVRYVKNPAPRGPGSNWNHSVAVARGKYIKFLHDDDYFVSDRSLGDFVRLLEEEPSMCFGFCACKVVDINGRASRVHQPSDRQVARLRRDPTTLFPVNFVGSPSVTIYRRQHHQLFNPRLRWVIDIDFYISLLAKCGRVAYTSSPLVAVTDGAAHQVTQQCYGNRDVEVPEYLYLFDKLFARRIPPLRVLVFLWQLFARFEISTPGQLRTEGWPPPGRTVTELLRSRAMLRRLG
jgi:glycosyltransferase involved in cell wall biosynthesis